MIGRFLGFWLIVLVVIVSLSSNIMAASLIDPSGTLSGDCSGGFTFDGGDPVLGSMAVASSVLACSTRDSGQSVTDVLAAGGFDKTLGDVVGSESRTITLGAVGGVTGGCPAPSTFDVLGHSYTVETGGVCDLARVLGWLVLLAATVVGAKILVGSAE